MQRALIIVTSHAELGATGEKTGFWWEELAAPYYELEHARYDVDIASPRGGVPPADPQSLDEQGKDPATTEAIRRFIANPEAMRKLTRSLAVREIDPSRYAVAYFVGGHGAMWDLPDNPTIARILSEIHDQGGVIAAVGHGTAAFKGARLRRGLPLIVAHTVTGFSDVEERTVGLSGIVPFPLESMLVQEGARYLAGPPFAPHVVISGHLVTGQNAASAALTAQKAVQLARLPFTRDQSVFCEYGSRAPAAEPLV